MELKERKCISPDEGLKPLNNEEIDKTLQELAPGWVITSDNKLQKDFPFENFKRGMAFAQEVALIAEKENHHPDICIQYSNVRIDLTTHDVGGISINDFILAAKIDDV